MPHVFRMRWGIMMAGGCFQRTRFTESSHVTARVVFQKSGFSAVLNSYDYPERFFSRYNGSYAGCPPAGLGEECPITTGVMLTPDTPKTSSSDMWTAKVPRLN